MWLSLISYCGVGNVAMAIPPSFNALNLVHHPFLYIWIVNILTSMSKERMECDRPSFCIVMLAMAIPIPPGKPNLTLSLSLFPLSLSIPHSYSPSTEKVHTSISIHLGRDRDRRPSGWLAGWLTAWWGPGWLAGWVAGLALASCLPRWPNWPGVRISMISFDFF